VSTSPELRKERAEWRASTERPVFSMERWFEMPRKWTFQMPKLREWVENRLEGDVLNLFGGVTRLTHPLHNPVMGRVILYNDLNPDLQADFRKDAYDLTQWRELEGAFDTVVFDPPYTAYQAVKTYGRKAQLVSHARDVVEFVLRPGGRVVSLGFNSTGMSESRGFYKEAVALVNCGGSHNDYLLVSERRVKGGHTTATDREAGEAETETPR
jgi:hypothetical protein